MDIFEAIYTRRSVRQFTTEPVIPEELIEIIKAGTWAPSGLNNQPWRFVIVRDRDKLSEIAKLTKYKKIIDGAAACIVVFVDREAMYNDVKDHQSMGACLQNMLLAAHGLGLGAVWLGEILNNSVKVRDVLKLPVAMELMAVLAIGHPAAGFRKSTRKNVSEVILKEI
ncbi:MAG: nitroreductase family protein [Nitrospirae bacterium]|nr:MAG: nitroreductase family protein [Nitrospirota bacterium]